MSAVALAERRTADAQARADRRRSILSDIDAYARDMWDDARDDDRAPYSVNDELRQLERLGRLLIKQQDELLCALANVGPVADAHDWEGRLALLEAVAETLESPLGATAWGYMLAIAKLALDEAV